MTPTQRLADTIRALPPRARVNALLTASGVSVSDRDAAVLVKAVRS